MKRTLLAVGVAVLISMMLVPEHDIHYFGVGSVQGMSDVMRHRPFFWTDPDCHVAWDYFALQTIFAATAAAVIVNLFPRKPRK